MQDRDRFDRFERFEVLAPIDRRIIAYLMLFVALVILSSVSITLYTEYLWFLSVGYAEVFFTTIYYRLLTFATFFAISFPILVVNNVAIRRSSKEFLGEAIKIPFLLDFVISIVFSYVMSTRWLQFLYFRNSTDFDIKDPIFNMDVSFYVFKLPFVMDIIATVTVMVAISLLMSIIVYAYIFRWVESFEELKELFPTNGYIHLSSLILVLFTIASAYLYFFRFELLTSPHGVVNGAGYTDVFIRIPALLLSSIIAVATGIASFYFGVKRRVENIFTLLFVFLVFALIANVLLPFGVQKFQVEPNELTLEEKYIGYSIKFTHLAYGLDVKKRPYDVRYNLTIHSIERNRGTIDNIRLWDHRPLLNVYRQIQQIRTYYVINDVDVDRYQLEKYTQVMVSARELSTDLLPAKAKTWLNEHLIYTHGYGIVMSPVNAISKEGLPELIVYDIPLKGEINVSRPEIYYGELTKNYVIVNTLQQEFDYPAGERNVFTYYKGSGGVPIDSYFKKAIFSIKFGDVNLFLSKYITNESKIMFHREIRERISTIAPFLILDRDPYIVVIDGKLYWVVDAYTVLDKFPYSAKYSFFNYIRNPVKIFVDAYNGTVSFYVIQEEPVIKTLAKAYPTLFKKNMSREMKEHIRYPIDLFKIQAEIYKLYHMEEIETFYNREDVWEIPHEMFEDLTIEMEPYYVILNLPNSNKTEFILMLPFTPKGRDNIISWMAARCDENYGEIILYEFPKGKLVYGPMQIEARIDQNAEISKLFTLWGQGGSKIIRGNLLVIPIENSIIYVEPVYLRAERTQIPELRGVIVAYNEYLTMKETLESALQEVFGAKPEVEEEMKKGVEELVRESINVYSRAIDEIKRGNWSGFGEMFYKLGKILRQLNESFSKAMG